MVVIIPTAIVILLLIWGITVYNRLITERLRVKTQWSQVDVVLGQRFDLISRLVEVIKGYIKHEQHVIDAILDARSGYLGAENVDERIQSNARLSGAMGRLMALSESYPELKSNESFLYLQKQIVEIEQRIADYRQFYNDTVLRYNSLLAAVPTNIIAKLFNFKKEIFFSADDSERVSLTIKF